MKQLTLAQQVEFQRYSKKTRPEQFFEEMGAAMPWAELLALVAPHYSRGETGRKPVGLEIEVPRDRASSLEPQLVAKGQTRWHSFDDKILSLYTRGMSCREIQGRLEEMYQVEVSPALISTVTEAVLDAVKAWQKQPLGAVYPISIWTRWLVDTRRPRSKLNKSVELEISGAVVIRCGDGSVIQHAYFAAEFRRVASGNLGQNGA